ncbi:MAG: membrane protein insertase YidC [Saccharofermentans sp.]|nr:membrane protein insertase YidC [Saccharofermentans sp.]
MIPSLLTILYTLIIYPLELFFEVVFTVANRIVGHPGWAIIILSLAVNFLVLPLYKNADEVQKKERDLEAKLAPGIDHIKKTFKGDERMMMLQTYYNQNNYSPLFVLKGSVSLLLQIPFFTAAYRFLSGLNLIRGISFGPILDLGSPDHMLVIAGISINVLPILMTLINFISGYVYTKDLPLKNKVQLYGMAVIFLVLLYNSPAGLAFYWTLNNLFSLLKNVFYRFKRPGFVLSVVSAVVGAIIILYVNTGYDAPYVAREIKLTIFGAALIIPFLIVVWHSKPSNLWAKITSKFVYSKFKRAMFFLSGTFMTVFTGFFIPSGVIKTSPSEFIDAASYRSPNYYIIYAACIAAGVFLVWGGIFFSLSKDNIKALMSYIWWALCPAAVVTYMFFGTKLGNLSTDLIYDEPFKHSISQQLLNAIAIVVAVAIMFVIYRYFKKITETFVFALIIAAYAISFVNMMGIQSSYSKLATYTGGETDLASIPLSTEGQNVMVIMLDRAPGYLVPYIFNEIPELQEQFDGFTYYPNTLAYGSHTKFAAPALFGGYEYTPQALCANDEVTMGEKHNQALLMMPMMFRDIGYDVTVCDPPFAGYEWVPNLECFEEEGIDAYITKGRFVDIEADFSASQDRMWLRNFFLYSIFKISPLAIQNNIYDAGHYNQADIGFSAGSEDVEFTTPQTIANKSESTGVSQVFMNAYTVLTNLARITDINDSEQNTFMYINNVTTHNTMMLSEPSYEPAEIVDNTVFDREHTDRFTYNGMTLSMNSAPAMSHYQCNVAAYIQLGEYFDYLRSMGVWDNTRIIVVSDHGPTADMFGGSMNIRDVNVESFNCLLMVKDFGDTGFTTCNDFMTNADVPYITTLGLIDNPINPFTGNPITIDGRYNDHLIYNSADWNVEGSDTIATREALTFSPGDWYSFNGTNILSRSSWEYVGER